MRFPADPALRRQLWRQWVHLDAPRGEARPVTQRGMNRAPAADDWARATINATPGVVDGLRAAIAEAVIDGQLSLADRERLTCRAVRLGLDRFEASLLVAAVQHREAERAGLNVIRRWKRPRQTHSVSKLVVIAATLEALAALGIVAWLRYV